jgi:hypothetical protein
MPVASLSIRESYYIFFLSICSLLLQHNITHTRIIPSTAPPNHLTHLQHYTNMCEFCTSIAGGDPVQNLHDAHACLKHFEDAIDRALAAVNNIEDEYRKGAIVYHKSQYAARSHPDFAEDQRSKTKAFFETSSVEDYRTVFANLTEMMWGFINLRAMHVVYSDSAEDIYHSIIEEIEPALLDLNAQLTAIKLEFLDRFDDAKKVLKIGYKLLNEERKAHEQEFPYGNPFGEEWSEAQYIEYGEPNELGIWKDRMMPHTMDREWEIYCSWVSSLPETQRAIGIGRTLEDIALSLLYDGPDGFGRDYPACCSLCSHFAGEGQEPGFSF